MGVLPHQCCLYMRAAAQAKLRRSPLNHVSSCRSSWTHLWTPSWCGFLKPRRGRCSQTTRHSAEQNLRRTLNPPWSKSLPFTKVSWRTWALTLTSHCSDLMGSVSCKSSLLLTGPISLMDLGKERSSLAHHPSTIGGHRTECFGQPFFSWDGRDRTLGQLWGDGPWVLHTVWTVRLVHRLQR